MNLLPGTTSKTFSLLCIGHRGVGKTVFLAGSFAELHSDTQRVHPQQWQFDCGDSNVQENIDTLLKYVAQTGEYPPPTVKITNFNFSLKRHNLRGSKTRSHLHWWDIPGEFCNIDAPDFKTMVFNSNGCCVFIDANALVHDPAYRKVLKDTIEKVVPIAALVHLNRVRYAFALILTKCDLLKFDPLTQQQLEERLQPLFHHLDAVKANYQTFYSEIPIVSENGVSTLKPKGAAAPLLWLVSELSKAYKPSSMNNLLELVTRLRKRRFQPQQETVDGAVQSLFTTEGKASKVKKILNLYLFLTTRRYILALLMVGLVGAISLHSMEYEWFLQRQLKNLEAPINAATQRQHKQYDQVIPVIEKIVRREPKRLELRLHLAYLYELTGQLVKAETAYDQVLAHQKNNYKALVGKALLRKAQGDTKTAQALLAQAQKAAPPGLKAQVRAWLKTSSSSPSPKLH